MKNYVIINGTNSNTITGLMINELPPISKPQMRTMIEEIDGRDGDIITDLGYSSYDKTFTIGLFGTGYDINEIISFFNDSGTITFSNEPDKYYYFKAISKIDYERLQKFKTATITFHCQPYKYPTSETPIEISYEYVEQENVESANMTNTEGETFLKISLKGNTSQTGTPTPTSPIPINVVSGDNTIEVCGKNRLNKDLIQKGYVTNNYGSPGTTPNVSPSLPRATLSPNNAIKVKPNTKYSFSMTSTTWRYAIAQLTSDKVSLGDTGWQTSSLYTITTNANCEYIGFNFSKTDNTNISDEEFNNFINANLMMFEGESVIPYEPYTSQTYPIYLGVDNLFDGTYTKQYVDSDGTLVSSNNTALTDYIEINGDLTISTIRDMFLAGIGYYDSSKTFISREQKADRNIKKLTYTTPNNAKYVRVYVNTGITNFTDEDLQSFAIQIEKGSKVNHISTTPIELCKIGDYQDYFTKNSGKNLVSTLTRNGNTVYVGDISTPTFIFEAGTYTVSYESSKTIGTYIQKESDATSTNLGNNKTITFTSNEKFCIWFWQSGLLVEDIVHCQLEKGNQATTYEPYGTNQWCKYNAIGKIVLDGSEDDNKYFRNGQTANYNQFGFYITGKQYGNTNIISNKFVINAGASAVYEMRGSNVDDYVAFNLKPTDCDYTKNGVKTWLSTHNTTVYYVLANPYLSLITDTTLINQLDNIENAFSYEGTTNVNQINNDKPFLLDLKAMKKDTNETIVNNMGNTTSKPTIALEGTGDINIYLNGTQMLKATLTDKMTIDTNNMEAYNPDTSALLNRHLVGDISKFTLSSGNNTIKMDGDLTKATITDYVRWL